MSKNQTKWNRVTLEAFMSCPHNLAFNRQTWMLASYDSKFTLCNYFERSRKNVSWDVELLNRAKKSLRVLSFFGLAEFQEYNQQLFQKTFKNMFKFEGGGNNYSPYVGGNTEKLLHNQEQSVLDKISELNALDIKLYEYAQNLFMKRLKSFKIIK
jgi:heparan sulfate 6-O-sulfotransferase HS6ST1